MIGVKLWEAEMYYTQSVIMSEGKEFVLRNPKPEEAAAVLDYLRIVSGETDYMIRLPEEVTMSVAEEESFLQSMADDPKKTMIGVFLKDRMGAWIRKAAASGRDQSCPGYGV